MPVIVLEMHLRVFYAALKYAFNGPDGTSRFNKLSQKHYFRAALALSLFYFGTSRFADVICEAVFRILPQCFCCNL